MVKLFISLSSNVLVHWWWLSTSIISLGALRWHCLARPFLSCLSGRIPVSFWQPECARYSCVVALNDCSHNSNSTLKDCLPKKEFATEEIPWNYLWLQNQVCEGTSKSHSYAFDMKCAPLIISWRFGAQCNGQRISEIRLEHKGSRLISKIIH